jgi:hypothetical protein
VGLVLEGVERITPRSLELLRANPEAVLPPVEQFELVPTPGQGDANDVVPQQ